MDETWKVIFEELALQPDHPNWELVAWYLENDPEERSRSSDEMRDTLKFKRRQRAASRGYHCNTREELLEFVEYTQGAYAREEA